MSRTRAADSVGEGPRHPRARYDLFGHDAALLRAARVIRSAKPPQAWLITGSPGIGKATLAYRIARYVLRYGASAEGPQDLAVPKNDVVSRQIEAESHPELLVLARRADEKGRMPTVVSVDEVRRLGSFFGMTAAGGGWRVVIVDLADEMNPSAANALLKFLEEPPRRALLLLLSYAPGRLLPTIRSRCQRLDLRPLDDETLQAALAHLLPEMAPSDRTALAEFSEGSPGLALRLAQGDGVALARDAQSMIDSRGAPDIPALLALADRVARKADGLSQFGDFLVQALARRIRARAQTADDELDRWVELRERISAMFARAERVYMEPRQTILSSALAIAAENRRDLRHSPNRPA